MLSIALVSLLLLALPALLLDLVNAIATPVLVPLVTSGVFWLMNTYTSFVAKRSDGVKRVLVIVVGTLLGWVGQHYGLDVTSAEGFAGSLVAIGIFQLGKAKRT